MNLNSHILQLCRQAMTKPCTTINTLWNTKRYQISRPLTLYDPPSTAFVINNIKQQSTLGGSLGVSLGYSRAPLLEKKRSS